ncbi:polysaccharide pyruvyl transferase family protein [Xanthomonas perforans]
MNYLGFAGHQNLGDDAILEVYRAECPQWRLWNVPVRKAAVLKSVVNGSLLRHRRSPLLLGGGTVLGRTLWRHHLRRTSLLLAPTRSVMLGAGVEDPEFVGDRRYTSDEELVWWPEILSEFSSITVRGPRSQQILGSVGVDAEIVGDPALLLGAAYLTDQVPTDGPIIVNVTHGEDQWGGSGNDWSPTLVPVLRHLMKRGAQIEFLSMEPEDVPRNERVMRELAADIVHHRPMSTAELEASLGNARLVIGTRLHTCVLAVAMGVPTIALEYRPKVRDFMASVQAEEFTYRVDKLDSDELIVASSALMDDPSLQLRKQNAAVDALRTSLQSRLSDLNRAIN